MKRLPDEMMVFHPAAQPAEATLSALRAGFESHLAAALPQPAGRGDLVVAAMREAVLSPGKRVRPLLLLAATQALGRPWAAALDAACALELVHAASLAMDDLPCMDDAALRRGRPTLHRQFGEDVAALAVVALLSHAFRLVAAAPALEPAARAQVTVVLADAVGCRGLVGGQLRDLRAAPDASTAQHAADVNQAKTGALFRAALEMAALTAGAGDGTRALLSRCGDEIGHAFQLLDDLKDDGGFGATGKDLHQDAGKATLPNLLGRDAARARLRRHLRRVESLLAAAFPDDDSVLRLLRLGGGFEAAQAPGPRPGSVRPPATDSSVRPG
ncbi:polyprenyl synthetase family protein [Azohydromonas aeria]|uniref:polyprenyl synthetase family protein n=1 Tax=Azohydromonas aeria TaxID=2590212 RepID=UPI0012FA5406|nr:polyprenyl synthetase family protein [Azohydromonas aeria]